MQATETYDANKMRGTMNKTIELRACVAAVHDNKILLVPHDDADGGPVLWKIPGGDLRSGESQEEAAIRGFTEETDLQVRIDELLDSSDAIVPDALSRRATVTFLGSVVGGGLTAGGGEGSHENVPNIVLGGLLRSVYQFGYGLGPVPLPLTSVLSYESDDKIGRW